MGHMAVTLLTHGVP